MHVGIQKYFIWRKSNELFLSINAFWLCTVVIEKGCPVPSPLAQVAESILSNRSTYWYQTLIKEIAAGVLDCRKIAAKLERMTSTEQHPSDDRLCMGMQILIQIQYPREEC